MKKICVTMAWAEQSRGGEIMLLLNAGATIADALANAASATVGNAATDLAAAVVGPIAHNTGVGVWGKVRPDSYVLRDQDRVEIYRALQADPKDARRTKAGPSNRKKSPQA